MYSYTPSKPHQQDFGFLIGSEDECHVLVGVIWSVDKILGEGAHHITSPELPTVLFVILLAV